MIYLITGTPGAGKSLYAVSTFIKSLMAPVALPDGTFQERRLVVDAIPGLALDHIPLTPGKVNSEGVLGPNPDGDGVWNWPDWCKPGDLIVIDEVQRWWRPRGMGTKPPREIQALETHRHKGVDFVIITQSASLVDQNVRRLIERHTHVRRVFGGGRAVLYDWDGCQVNTSQVKNATTSLWSYPKNAYKLYTSSTLHIKPKQKIPLWIFIPLIALVGMLFVGPSAYHTLFGAMTGKGISREKEKEKDGKPGAASAALPAPALPGAAGAPQPAAPPGAPSLPVFPGVSGSDTISSVDISHISGCMAMKDLCRCYSEDGFLKSVPEPVCRSALATAGAVVPLRFPSHQSNSPAFPVAMAPSASR